MTIAFKPHITFCVEDFFEVRFQLLMLCLAHGRFHSRQTAADSNRLLWTTWALILRPTWPTSVDWEQRLLYVSESGLKG